MNKAIVTDWRLNTGFDSFLFAKGLMAQTPSTSALVEGVGWCQFHWPSQCVVILSRDETGDITAKFLPIENRFIPIKNNEKEIEVKDALPTGTV